MKPSKDISTLIEIMRRLRDPDGGCPWDLEQDFKSISPHTIEEAYEVADAIEREDMDDLRSELGDLLFQPIYYAQMASETGEFDFGDVVYGICEKLINRHPHVFGEQRLNAADDVKASWEQSKAKERATKALKTDTNVQPSVLDDVPKNFPSLLRADKLAKRAARVGFDWPDYQGALDKVREETEEVATELASGDNTKTEEEIGDLLFAMASLARKTGVDPETALTKANRKFERRFKYIEQRCSDEDIALESAGLEKLEEFWAEIRQTDKD